MFDVSSTLDGSSVSPVSAEVRDLQGCGSPTHNAFAISGNFNTRVQCGAPYPLYTLSAKILSGRDAYLNEYQVEVPNGDILLTWGFTHSLIWSTIAEGGIPAAVQIGPAGRAPTDIKGGQFIVSDPYGDVNVITQVSIPRIKPRFDACGNLDGYSGSAAFTMISAHPETCEKVLVASGSVRAYWRTRGGFPLMGGVGAAGHQALTTSRMVSVMPVAQLDSMAADSRELFTAANNVIPVYGSPSRTNIVELKLF